MDNQKRGFKNNPAYRLITGPDGKKRWRSIAKRASDFANYSKKTIRDGFREDAKLSVSSSKKTISDAFKTKGRSLKDLPEGAGVPISGKGATRRAIKYRLSGQGLGHGKADFGAHLQRANLALQTGRLGFAIKNANDRRLGKASSIDEDGKKRGLGKDVGGITGGLAGGMLLEKSAKKGVELLKEGKGRGKFGRVSKSLLNAKHGGKIGAALGLTAGLAGEPIAGAIGGAAGGAVDKVAGKLRRKFKNRSNLKSRNTRSFWQGKEDPVLIGLKDKRRPGNRNYDKRVAFGLRRPGHKRYKLKTDRRY